MFFVYSLDATFVSGCQSCHLDASLVSGCQSRIWILVLYLDSSLMFWVITLMFWVITLMFWVINLMFGILRLGLGYYFYVWDITLMFGILLYVWVITLMLGSYYPTIGTIGTGPGTPWDPQNWENPDFLDFSGRLGARRGISGLLGVSRSILTDSRPVASRGDPFRCLLYTSPSPRDS